MRVSTISLQRKTHATKVVKQQVVIDIFGKTKEKPPNQWFDIDLAH
jgi:hypothetical protein